MALDGITVSNVVKELQAQLTDARISKIAQPESDELMLTFKCTGRTQVRLLMSASASLPLIYLTDANKPGPMTAPNFCMLLRKHIGGGRIVRIWQPGLERIIHFEIEHYDEMGDLRHKDLILELMGKHSNIIFCDEDHTIIDSIKHISAQTSLCARCFRDAPILFLRHSTRQIRFVRTSRNSWQRFFPNQCRFPRRSILLIPVSVR